MDTQDGTPVTDVTSEGAISPAVAEPTVDPMEAKIAVAIQEALKKQEPEIARRIQSEADKRVAPLQRRLTEAERRAQALEGTLTTLPNTLGPDVDSDVRSRVQFVTMQAELNQYKQRDQAIQQAEREQAFRQQLHEDTRSRVAKMGIDPDDPRLKYDLNAPTPNDFFEGVMDSVRKITKEEERKSIKELVAQEAAETEARLAKASGVHSQDTEGGSISGQQTFTRAQIKDRAFYKANKEAIEAAHKGGRIKD